VDHAYQQTVAFGTSKNVVFSASRERYGNCFRISCGHAFSPRLAEAIRTLGRIATGVTREGNC